MALVKESNVDAEVMCTTCLSTFTPHMPFCVECGSKRPEAEARPVVCYDREPLLSDQAMKTIQSLQGQMQRVRKQLKGAEIVAERAIVSVEQQNSHYRDACSRQERVSWEVALLQSECGEDAQYERLLAKQLEASREELAIARMQEQNTVPGHEYDALRAELECLLEQLATAEDEGCDLRAMLADAEMAQARGVRRRVEPTASGGLQACRGNKARYDPRMTEVARQLSARAVAGQKERDLRHQQERAAFLSEQKKTLDMEWRHLCKHTAGLEQRMEALRMRNRQLEAQQRRTRELNKEHETSQLAELRRHQRQIHVLTDCLREAPTNYDQCCKASMSSSRVWAPAPPSPGPCGASQELLSPACDFAGKPTSFFASSPSAKSMPPFGQELAAAAAAVVEAASKTRAGGPPPENVRSPCGREAVAESSVRFGRLDVALSRTQTLIDEVSEWCGGAVQSVPR